VPVLVAVVVVPVLVAVVPLVPVVMVMVPCQRSKTSTFFRFPPRRW
jgi:hypothetical protein